MTSKEAVTKQKIALVILDGWGVDQTWGGNAIGLANTPVFDTLFAECPATLLDASDTAVGLPYGEPGNSEVGHLNLGAGQPVSQGLTAINKSIEKGDFYFNPRLIQSMKYSSDGALHLIGLLSDGAIHSHISHLFALLDLAKNLNRKDVYIHCITDGRDTAPTSGLKFVNELSDKINAVGVGTIASVAGRYYAMDRDNNWDRIKSYYEAVVGGVGPTAKNAQEVLKKSYAENVTDEFVKTTIIEKTPPIKDGDSIIFYNFRSDRARQLTRAFVQKHFEGFKRKITLKNISFGTFGSYQENLPINIIFESEKIAQSLASIFSQRKITHLHAAETEKYAHVTYFFNGGEEKAFEGESRILVPSPSVATYDLKPEMSANLLTRKVIEKIDNFDFSVINFANADMVGHTGKIEAAIKAAETVDSCLQKLISKAEKNDIILIITADHGNADQMINPLTGLADTEHTRNPVPFIIKGLGKNIQLNHNGRLCDVAPTIIDIFDLSVSNQMTGKSLIIK